MRSSVRTVLEEADGLVLWGGWKVTAPTGPLPWDENAPCGLDTCLTKKLAHTACMKALSEALGKVNL